MSLFLVFFTRVARIVSCILYPPHNQHKAWPNRVPNLFAEWMNNSSFVPLTQEKMRAPRIGCKHPQGSCGWEVLNFHFFSVRCWWAQIETTPNSRGPSHVRCAGAPSHFKFDFLKSNHHTGQESSFQLMNETGRRGHQQCLPADYFHSNICKWVRCK